MNEQLKPKLAKVMWLNLWQTARIWFTTIVLCAFIAPSLHGYDYWGILGGAFLISFVSSGPPFVMLSLALFVLDIYLDNRPIKIAGTIIGSLIVFYGTFLFALNFSHNRPIDFDIWNEMDQDILILYFVGTISSAVFWTSLYPLLLMGFKRVKQNHQ